MKSQLINMFSIRNYKSSIPGFIFNCLSLFVAAIFFSSCEKVIDLDLPEGEKLIYVDAWINDKPGTQTIKMLRAVSFDDPGQPEAISNATISVTDVTANKTYPFTFKSGAYQYDAAPGTSVGVTGHEYRLNIMYDGDEFEASDKLNRVTKIDSITLELREESGDEKAGFYAEFFAKDLIGATDYYWIQTYKNGTRNNYLNDMVSIDGSFYEGISDGYEFIPPFSEGITSEEKPYQKGDEVKVILRSVTRSSYDFLDQAISQVTSGGLFSQVLQNVPTNIKNKNSQSTRKIYGWFGTSGETSLSRKVE